MNRRMEWGGKWNAKERWTADAYNNHCANSEQVPQQIFLPGEPRTAHLKLSHVLIYEVGVEDDAELGSREEEGCEGPPYSRREPEQRRRRKVEPPERQ